MPRTTDRGDAVRRGAPGEQPVAGDKPPRRAQKKRPKPKKPAVAAVLESFLTDADLSGVDLVRAEMARRLALAAETAPDYALARMVDVLDGLLASMGEGV